ncbi:hypothetical protein PCC9214_05380 (plasmid) [Planktothrix tepida]|uniref:Uncharacterized protein n=2 Tax=Planktothrix TaxID=54304 RepID=A0A1J1LMZ8_9CYAN|nr:hypothetical protein PCC9214_05380 [Planktothrix tepida]CUR33920.1 membrane hypothetical protein [Planktothrix tepida PCC 9214]
MDLIPILLEEYKAAHAERLNAIQSRHTVLTFGFSSIGLLLTFLASMRGKSNEALTILSLYIIPFLCIIIGYSYWLDTERQIKSQHSIVKSEYKINQYCNPDQSQSFKKILNSSIAFDQDKELRFQTIIYQVLFSLVAIISLMITIFESLSSPYNWMILIISILLMVGFFLFILIVSYQIFFKKLFTTS